MTDDRATDDPLPPRRWPHVVRLAVFTVFLAVLFYLVVVQRVIDVERVRALVASTGPAAPLAFAATSAVLGVILVPGPLLAAAAGVLFGPAVGTLVTLAATVGSATLAGEVGRRAGRPSARVLLGPRRADRLDAVIAARGLWAVVGQRFVPGISDALASYAFGALGVPRWQLAVGAFIGSAPRAFAYTALGASIAGRSAPLAGAAIAVWCLTAVAGVLLAHRGWRAWRRRTDGQDG